MKYLITLILTFTALQLASCGKSNDDSSSVIPGVTKQQVREACLKVIKGDGTYNRSVTADADSIITMHTNDNNYDVTYTITTESGGIRLTCKDTDKDNEKEGAKIWENAVLKGFNQKID
jgi:hypothetical protein